MERDNTPFGGAQNAGNGSQPQIFSTDQTSQDKQSISSKLGTSRSRFNSRANRYAEQQANYSAAQSIAQNQNTPQFFSDAVMASTPAPVEPPKKSKAPLFIGLAVALVAVVAVVLVVVLLPKGGDIDDGKAPEQVYAETVLDDLRDILDDGPVAQTEDTLLALYNGSISISGSVFSEDALGNISDGLDNINRLSEGLNKFDISQLTEENASRIEEIKESIKSRAAAYQKIYDGFNTLYKATYGNNLEAQKELSTNEYAQKLINAYYQDEALYNQYSNAGCDYNESLPACQPISDLIDENDKILQDKTALSDYFKSLNNFNELDEQDSIGYSVGLFVKSVESKE